jgi:hypothetical protein
LTAGGLLAGPEWWRPLLVLALTMWCWLCIWFGVSGLVRRAMLTEPVLLLFGLGVAGAAASLLLVQAGDSQRFFFEAARPYLSVAAAGGFAAVLELGRSRRTRLLMVLAAVVAGAALVGVVRMLDGETMPTITNTPGPTRLALAVGWPYAVLFAGVLAAVAALSVARRRVAALRGVSHALVIALLAGFGLVGTLDTVVRLAADVAAHGWRGDVRRPVADPLMPGPIVTDGTLRAGRWLRDHSDPADLVATNAHCLPAQFTQCVNLHFAVTAYTERRVLVEGWGFTERAHRSAIEQGTWVGFAPYWDADKLAANDAVFLNPTEENAAVLRDKYRVRWLFVDETATVSDDLDRVATLRFRSGSSAVYELTGTGTQR